LCGNTQLAAYDGEVDDQGHYTVIYESFVAADNVCACIQDGAFTPASSAQMMDLLQNDPKALAAEYDYCELYGLPKEGCVDDVIMSFIGSAYEQVSEWWSAIRRTVFEQLIIARPSSLSFRIYSLAQSPALANTHRATFRPYVVEIALSVSAFSLESVEPVDWH
jgi:hypothetical protein